MKVQSEQHVTLLAQLLDHIFVSIYRWVLLRGRLLPVSVQVAASQIATVVTVDDAVRVEHRDDPKFAHFAEGNSDVICGVCQEIKDAFHHPA